MRSSVHFWLTSNFMEWHGTRPVMMRFLHSSSRGRTLVMCFCSQRLPWCFTASWFAGSQLCTSHGTETSSLIPFLLPLELGELEAVLESNGGTATAVNTVQQLKILGKIQEKKKKLFEGTVEWPKAGGLQPKKEANILERPTLTCLSPRALSSLLNVW